MILMNDFDGKLEGILLIELFLMDNVLYELIVEVCWMVFDFEILVNIYDFGLIYMIKILDESDVKVIMILIVFGCFVVGEMLGWVQDVVSMVFGVWFIDVEMIWEFQWGMDMMSDEVCFELGFM